MRIYKLAALGLFAILPLAAVACGGSSKKSSNTPSSSDTSSANPTSGSKSPGATATSGSSSSDNPLKDIQGAGNALKTSNLKLTYDMTQTDSDGKVTKGSLSMSQKDKESYFKLVGDIGTGENGTFIVIDDGTNTFICTEQPTKQCIKSTSSGSGSIIDAFQPGNIADELTANGGSYKQVGDQTIAGRGAKCYKGSDETGSGTVCIDKKSGVLLSVDATQTDGSKVNMKATEVGSASDSDFKPPYNVISLPSQ